MGDQREQEQVEPGLAVCVAEMYVQFNINENLIDLREKEEIEPNIKSDGCVNFRMRSECDQEQCVNQKDIRIMGRTKHYYYSLDFDVSSCKLIIRLKPNDMKNYSGVQFEFDITTDLVQKQKRAIFKDQHFMDVNVINELAQRYRDKDLYHTGKYYTVKIDNLCNWGADIILFIRDINDSLNEDTLVFLTDGQEYVHDKIQALHKGIDNLIFMIVDNIIIGYQSQNRTMMCTP
ncbi:MAG: hypothetical protein EZS28_019981 [Streblomastix strix]|uniref:Uncharacterized protein n=1 Tax=Streblomastix strix TaxID=222440 RepID=A0A5J4VQC3_9EUKA|nr:MAG: hypothetical protein EZS28_019981 [Streblomastix strix]